MEATERISEVRKVIQADIFLEADRILYFAKERKVILRLFGGVGVWFSSPSAAKAQYARSYNDLDFVGLRKQSSDIENLFSDLGYRPKELFNKLQGDLRLMFLDDKNDRRIDIFLDKFVMCHEFDLRDRLALGERTIPLSDLLMTKLQIVEINNKDIMDATLLVLDNPLLEGKKPDSVGIDLSRIIGYTSGNWGVYKTLTTNVMKIVQILSKLPFSAEEKIVVLERLSRITNAIESAPKSLSWKMRAKVGERKRWYELPEST